MPTNLMDGEVGRTALDEVTLLGYIGIELQRERSPRRRRVRTTGTVLLLDRARLFG